MAKAGILAVLVVGFFLPISSSAEEGKPLAIDEKFTHAFAECIDIVEEMERSVTLKPDPSLMSRYEALLSNGNIDYCFDMTASIHAMAMQHYITKGDEVNADNAYLRAVYREDKLVSEEASRALGAAYLLGDKGLLRDPDKAILLLEKARELGSGAADYLLGVSYFLGLNGIEQDHKKGFRLLKDSADKESGAMAQYLVGRAYIYGQGTTINYQKGHRYSELAAYGGSPEAQFLTGLGYISAKGVEFNKEKGYAWLALAMANGNELARNTLNDIRWDMSTEEEAKAQNLAAELTKKIEKNTANKVGQE